MSNEKWLNGWDRNNDTVLIGTAIHCAGCGRVFGITTVSFDDDLELPEQLPDWPFPQNNCPLCSNEYRDLTIDDLIKLPISMLRQAIIKKRKQS